MKTEIYNIHKVAHWGDNIEIEINNEIEDPSSHCIIITKHQNLRYHTITLENGKTITAQKLGITHNPRLTICTKQHKDKFQKYCKNYNIPIGIYKPHPEHPIKHK